MSREWKPIKAAPVDERIEIGWYSLIHDEGKPRWWTDAATVWTRTWYGRKIRVPGSERASHWRHLPEPPK